MDERTSKKEQFEKSDKSKRSNALLWVVGFAFLVCASLAVWAFSGPQVADYPQLRADGGQVRIPVRKINDEKAHFFSYQADENAVKFFVLQSSDGIIRAAFDACDVCYQDQRGYSQAGDAMVCNNCGQKFAAARINEVKGGCNPAPINRKLQDDHLVIAAADLAAGSWYFAPSGREQTKDRIR